MPQKSNMADGAHSPIDAQSTAATDAIAAILALVRERTGVDFTLYRRATVTRRIVNRMISVGATTFDHYLEVLQSNETEPRALLERVTIKVSRFYRDPATFDPLRTAILPRLAQTRGADPLALWCAGCGCGEEAYTLAMLLDECNIPGTVYATDVDPAALRWASQGWYAQRALAGLPAELKNRYCIAEGDGFRLHPGLGDRVRFSRHDLTAHEPPPMHGQFDLVSCRNVLIYFGRESQERAMQTLRRHLKSNGYLCLGEAEWPLPTVAGSLDALPHKTRIFRAVGRTTAWSYP
jgi:chemotaxis methyl-accepting protein methylase